MYGLMDVDENVDVRYGDGEYVRVLIFITI